jgi:hypothetical protein
MSTLEEAVQIVKNRLLQTEPTTLFTATLLASWSNDQELNGHGMLAIFERLVEDAGTRNFIFNFDNRVTAFYESGLD